MKILHTSDWHLGQVFYDHDRHTEQQDMLRQIAEIVRVEQPDAMLVSGDIFDTGSPSSAAVEMYNHALLHIHEACPTMQIILTGGNHDSAARIVVNNELWQHFNVSVIGTVSRNQEDENSQLFDNHIVKVTAANNIDKGYIAAVPYCYESNYPSVQRDLPREQRLAAYYQGLLDRVQELNTEQLPVVLMAHLAVTGSDLSGHDNIGGMETRTLANLGTGYDYAALGHIHTPQNISTRVRYSGAPISINFGEKFEHSVSIVHVEHGVEPKIETRVIHNLIPLCDFPQPAPLPFDKVLAQLHAFPDDKLCYLRLLVEVDETLTSLAYNQIEEVVQHKRCRVCRIQTFYAQRVEVADSSQLILRATEIKEKSPLEIAQIFFDMKQLSLSESKQQLIAQATEQANTYFCDTDEN